MNKEYYYACKVESNNPIDMDMYVSIEELGDLGCFFGGNTDYLESDYFSKLHRVLAYFDNSFDVDVCTDEEFYDEVKKQFNRISNHPLTDSDIADIEDWLCRRYPDASRIIHNEDSICEILSIILGKEYTCTAVCGSVQREYQILFYPTDKNADFIKYVSALYFGMGDDYKVADEPLTNLEDFDSACNEYVFVPYYVNNVEKYIADELGHSPVKLIKRVRMISYRYEEIDD